MEALKVPDLQCLSDDQDSVGRASVKHRSWALLVEGHDMEQCLQWCFPLSEASASLCRNFWVVLGQPGPLPAPMCLAAAARG